MFLYAGDTNINRKKNAKKYVEIQKKMFFFRKHNGNNFFSSPNVL